MRQGCVSQTLLLATFLALVPGAAKSAAPPIFGIARAQDGDSLEIDGTRVRLFGIDAPEFDQTCTRGSEKWDCGSAAAQNLVDLVTGREVRCTNLGTDQYGRILGRCTISGLDVNQVVVQRGFAVAFRKYSSDYVAAEQQAKAAGLGIWAGRFEAPSDVRRSGDRQAPMARKLNPGPTVVTLKSGTSGCAIKGNRSRRGEWIYHLPGMPYYNQTQAEEMFCTEAQARAAGYRRARTPR